MILSKKEFMQQYVLNRAFCNIDGLCGDIWAKESEKAYNYIKEKCEETNNK